MDLYSWGERLSWMAKSAQKKYKSAEERNDELMSLAWQDCFRKTAKETIAVALVVLKVEEIVKGKGRITA